MENCAVCGEESSLRCSSCKASFYCSQEHQKLHWKVHKKVCRKYRMEFSGHLGPHLVASRNLKEGSLLFMERPVVTCLEGLDPFGQTNFYCLGCFRKLATLIRQCSKCYWPICSELCEESPYHVPECQLLSNPRAARVIDHLPVVRLFYSLLVPLFRMLVLKTQKPEEFERLLTLRNHEVSQVFDAMESFLPVVYLFISDEEFGEEMILDLWKIFCINQIQFVHPTFNEERVFLFLTGSCFEPNCCENCVLFMDRNNMGYFRCSVDIPKNSNLKICFVNSLLPTRKRQELMILKGILCRCERCLDPTELGSYVGAIKCAKCSTGFLNPCDPMAHNTIWACEKCNHFETYRAVTRIDSHIEEKLLSLKFPCHKEIAQDNVIEHARLLRIQIDTLEEFARYALTQVHPNYCYIIRAYESLVTAYLYLDTYEPLGLQDLETATNVIRRLLNVRTIIKPGCMQFYPRLRYEVIFLERRIERMKVRELDVTPDPKEKEEMLKIYVDDLKRCLEMLEFDPCLDSKLQQEMQSLLEEIEAELLFEKIRLDEEDS